MNPIGLITEPADDLAKDIRERIIRSKKLVTAFCRHGHLFATTGMVDVVESSLIGVYNHRCAVSDIADDIRAWRMG